MTQLNRFYQRMQIVWQSEPRLLILAMALLMLNLLLLAGLSSFLSPAILDTERDVISLQAEVRRMGLGDTPLSTSQLYRKAGEDVERVYSLIPERSRLSDLILDVSKLAQQAGLDIDSISYDPKAIEEFPLLSYTLSFTVQGTYRQLKKFVYLLEVSPRIVTLDSINLVESKDAGVSMRIKMTTFFKEQGPA